MKVLTIGGATQDILIEYKDKETMQLCTTRYTQAFTLLGKGAKIEVNKIHYFTGGGATNSAVSFKRMGYSVTSFFKIANDQQGAFILQLLAQEGVVTQALKTNQECTGISFIIPTQTGDRTIFAYRGANGTIEHNEIPTELIKNSDCVYITSLSGQSSQLLLPITMFAKKHGIKVANNPGKSQLLAGADMLRKSLPNIDILILNATEAQQLMLSLVQTDDQLRKKITMPPKKTLKNAPQLLQEPIISKDICFDLQHFFSTLLQHGPEIIAVTNGEEGVYVATKEKMYFHPSIESKIANTLGAGDAFGSCFVASLMEKESVEQAMINGIVNASSVISYLDAKTGLLTKDELKKRAQKIGPTNIQKFSW